MHNRSNVRFLKILVIGVIIFSHSILAFAADDWEFWPGNSLKVKLNKKFDLAFLQEFRINDYSSTFYQYVLYAGGIFKVNKYIDTALWYKFVETKHHHHWDDSHRIDMDGVLKYDLSGFKLYDRSRFEGNFTTGHWLYRNKIKIGRPVSFCDGKFKFTPYIFNEFFFHMGVSGSFRENRGGAGIKAPFAFGTNLNFYYMSRAKKKDGVWTNANVLNLSLGMVF